MAALFIFSPTIPSSHLLLSRPTSTATTLSYSSPQPPLRFSVSSAASISGRRRVCVVTRAGPPSASTYLFAFLFPLSMLLATILTSIKIDQKLDQDFFDR